MDDAKVKSEARRRKIIEESEKRLEKILNCKLEDFERDPTALDNDKVKKVVEKQKRVWAPVVAEVCSYDDEPEDVRCSTDVTNWAHNFGFPSETHTPNRIWKKLGFKLVVLAIIVRIIHIFKLGYLFGETIVIPFALFMMTQLGSCQFDRNVRGSTGTILFFIGMTSKTIRNLLICYNVVTSILVYFGIYFFTFVCTHLTFVMVFGI